MTATLNPSAARQLSTAMLVCVLRAKWTRERIAAHEALGGMDTAALHMSHGHEELYAPAIAAMPKGVEAVFAARLEFMDGWLSEFIQDSEVAQVVFIGSGYESFAHRVTAEWGAGTTDDLKVYEIDFPEMIAAKKEAVEVCRSRGLAYDDSVVRYVPCDFAAGEKWIDKLCEAGWGNGPTTMFVMMGVLYYLTQEEVRAMFATIASLGQQHQMLFDYATPTGGADAELAMQRLREMGAPIKYLTHDITPLLTTATDGYLPIREESVTTYIKRAFNAPIEPDDKRALRFVFANYQGFLADEFF